jgi:hypothetical protein
MPTNSVHDIGNVTRHSGDRDRIGKAGSETISTEIQTRVDRVDWTRVHSELDLQGWSLVPQLLTLAEADLIASLYKNEKIFRSRIIMNQHGFGRGEYKYFSYPLPPLIQALRTATYPYLAPIANRWHQRMGDEARFPTSTLRFSRAATRLARPVLHRCSSSMDRRTTTACIETFMGSTSSQYRSRCCWISQV